MKKIELTTEWVLDKLASSHHANGDGIVFVGVDSGIESLLVELALNAIGIKYIEEEQFNEHNNTFYMYYGFNVEDIKDECPKLYKSLLKLTKSNKKAYLRNRLTDSSYEIEQNKLNDKKKK